MATGGPIQFLDQGVLQTSVMGLDLTAWDGEWSESFAIAVLSRQSGVLIAVPEGAFSPEVLQAGAFAAMDDLVGPSTRVTLPAVFEELDGTETPHTEEIPVVLIDFHKNTWRAFEASTQSQKDPASVVSRHHIWKSCQSPIPYFLRLTPMWKGVQREGPNSIRQKRHIFPPCL